LKRVEESTTVDPVSERLIELSRILCAKMLVVPALSAISLRLMVALFLLSFRAWTKTRTVTNSGIGSELVR